MSVTNLNHFLQAEFHALISHVVDDHGEASDGGINPEITGEDAEFFMKEFDIDGDGTVSHDEYVQKMYHDEPQVILFLLPPLLRI